ncbi:hypothetical protein O6R05_02290 [Peptoniphilus equinus]|uniref:Autotransporter domain-containing protein n=1 Tax=Peptoniphilus equinus TaxID=3016343 RepID=A0ABY7QUD4_9FIRM|nr:hypothetical protein [Peptoniphilus equinus]WBW50392.1 hypothetical protein O6R05_02290 [Peptoniphilus equinus]
MRLAANQSWNAWISDRGTTVSSSSQHSTVTGAQVRKSYGIFGVGFRFEYSTYRSEMSRITSVYAPDFSSEGGTISLSYPITVQGIATINASAKAEMAFTFAAHNAAGSYPGSVGVTAGNDHGSGGIISY